MLPNTVQALAQFFSTYIADGEPEADDQATRAFIAASPDQVEKVAAQARLLLADPDLSLEDLGSTANRWFGEPDEARAWLNGILTLLSGATEGSGGVVVKDSNGTPLAEGDSVTVIKDLKVKGGSSDLKRGTQIKKIHLIGDPDHIECRVDGSTLVLKTIFLKKA